MTKPLFILNGPNLNLLGRREPEIYGRGTLADIGRACEAKAAEHGLAIDFRQSNHEGEIVEAIHEAIDGASGLIVNAGALTHTSIALRDAIAAVTAPVIEVHITNIHARESFRHRSHLTAVSTGMICGLGPQGYTLAVDAVAHMIEARPRM